MQAVRKPLAIFALALPFVVAAAPTSAQAEAVYTKLATYTCFYGDCSPGIPSTRLVETASGVFVGSNEFGILYTLTSSGNFGTFYALNTSYRSVDTPLQASDGLLYFPGGNGQSALIFKVDLAQPSAQQIVTPAPYKALPPVETPDQLLHSASVPVNYDGQTFTLTLDGQVASGVAFPKSKALGTLLVAADGTLYGLTNPFGGGASSLVRFLKNGRPVVVTTIPQAFPSLAEASDGNFYGCSGGSLFRLSPTGDYAVIYTFPGGAMGSAPYDCVLQASDGLLYGTTRDGGAYGYGTVFAATLAGDAETVYSFRGDDQLQQPSAYTSGLVQGSDGRLYGQTSGPYVNSPGSFIGATTYSLDLGLPKPLPVLLRATPKRAAVGTTVLVTGHRLLGTTAVSVNGVAADFVVKAAEYLQVTIPPGATSGKLTVTTPNGTATSRFPIVVR